jgi:hypothetical protein
MVTDIQDLVSFGIKPTQGVPDMLCRTDTHCCTEAGTAGYRRTWPENNNSSCCKPFAEESGLGNCADVIRRIRCTSCDRSSVCSRSLN